MANAPPLDLQDIIDSERISLSRGLRLLFYDNARVCMAKAGHSERVVLRIDGSYDGSYLVTWSVAPSEEDMRSYADLAEAAERGACGVAFLLLFALTEHTVIERSAKTTGFDFWLGTPGEGFQKKARLEVSGILATPRAITSRTRLRVEQTRRSDHLMLPAYVVVVEFSKPTARVTKR